MASLTAVEELARWLHKAYSDFRESAGSEMRPWKKLSDDAKVGYRDLALRLLNDPPGILVAAVLDHAGDRSR